MLEIWIRRLLVKDVVETMTLADAGANSEDVRSVSPPIGNTQKDNTKHEATDRECPIRKRILTNIKKNIDYGP